MCGRPNPEDVKFCTFSHFCQAKYRSLMEEGLVPDRGVGERGYLVESHSRVQVGECVCGSPMSRMSCETVVPYKNSGAHATRLESITPPVESEDYEYASTEANEQRVTFVSLLSLLMRCGHEFAPTWAIL